MAHGKDSEIAWVDGPDVRLCPLCDRLMTAYGTGCVCDAFRCSLCGLSDHGYERFVAAGFDPHPCRACAGHFAARGRH